MTVVKTTVELSSHAVRELNAFSRQHLGVDDFVALTQSKPRQALAVVVAYARTLVADGQEANTTSRSDGFVTTSNDPRVMQSYVDALPGEYRGKTVEVTLVMQKLVGSKTVVFTAPPSESDN